MDCILLGYRDYSFTDEKSGELKTGTTLWYCYTNEKEEGKGLVGRKSVKDGISTTIKNGLGFNLKDFINKTLLFVFDPDGKIVTIINQAK